jgi:hypothetical protein
VNKKTTNAQADLLAEAGEKLVGAELAGTGDESLPVPAAPRRVNKIAQGNEELTEIIAQAGTGGLALEDLTEVADACLQKALSHASGERLRDPQFLAFLRSEELHKAKINKLKADVESVNQNVATPAFFKSFMLDVGQCIKAGNEEVVFEEMRKAETDAEKDAIIRLGTALHLRIMAKIAAMGYGDTRRTA